MSGNPVSLDHPVSLDQWIADTAQTADREQRELLALFQKEWSDGARVNPLLFPLDHDAETWERHFEWFLKIERYQVPVREWEPPDAIPHPSDEDETVVIGSRLSDPDQETVLMDQMPDTETPSPFVPPTAQKPESIPVKMADDDKTAIYIKEEKHRETDDVTTIIMDYKKESGARDHHFEGPDTLLMEEGLLTVHDRPAQIKPGSPIPKLAAPIDSDLKKTAAGERKEIIVPDPNRAVQTGPAKSLSESVQTDSAPDMTPAAGPDDADRFENVQAAPLPDKAVQPPSRLSGPQPAPPRTKARPAVSASTSLESKSAKQAVKPPSSADAALEVEEAGAGPPKRKIKKKKKPSPDHPSKKLAKAGHADNQGLELELDDLEDMSWLDE